MGMAQQNGFALRTMGCVPDKTGRYNCCILRNIFQKTISYYLIGKNALHYGFTLRIKLSWQVYRL